jgi:hypothetical protein
VGKSKCIQHFGGKAIWESHNERGYEMGGHVVCMGEDKCIHCFVGKAIRKEITR